MDPVALAGLCALLLKQGADTATLHAATCPVPAVATLAGLDPAHLRPLVDWPGARDGIARVAFAEAGNQGDSGLAAVVYAILNRLKDGRWGGSVDAVLDSRGQFEPVMRAGGRWRGLPPATPAQQARIDTILNLVLDGRLPDLTGGARYFQNPTVVAGRARAGTVSPGLVNFGGATPSAVIGAHSFYIAAGHSARTPAGASLAAAARRLFVGENRAVEPASVAGASAASGRAEGDPNQAIFVRPDGRVEGP